MQDVFSNPGALHSREPIDTLITIGKKHIRSITELVSVRFSESNYVSQRFSNGDMNPSWTSTTSRKERTTSLVSGGKSSEERNPGACQS